jgi:FMN phosphatase YigB (HAD superfamily)
MKAITLVIDLDSTLYKHDSEVRADRLCAIRANRFLKDSGLLKRMSHSHRSHIARLIIQGRMLSISRLLGKDYGIDREEFEDYVLDGNPGEAGIKRDRKLVSLISILAKNYRIVLFTNSKRIWVGRTIKALGLGGIITMDMVMSPELMDGCIKPEPCAFRALMRKFGITKNSMIFLDDRMYNVRQARKMGITSMHIDNGGKRAGKSIYSALERIISYSTRQLDITKL